ncbi:unnamed protein product [Dovyalis caffra]|uniref:Uncharacterized protein n=1 Tax=Dovyalis caffra TaxID=77055 RepID=A0AAV1R9Z1_9ROSI|nr:unnamed protein product [Dovyalis caffra]
MGQESKGAVRSPVYGSDGRREVREGGEHGTRLTALKVWDKRTPRSCWMEGHHTSRPFVRVD